MPTSDPTTPAARDPLGRLAAVRRLARSAASGTESRASAKAVQSSSLILHAKSHRAHGARNARKTSTSRSSSETPMIRHPGMKQVVERWSRPGSNSRRDKWSIAPNSTTICGCRGATPGELFLNSEPNARRRRLTRSTHDGCESLIYHDVKATVAFTRSWCCATERAPALGSQLPLHDQNRGHRRVAHEDPKHERR